MAGIAASVSQAATFTSAAPTGNWSAPATWTVTGTDADGIPDNDDDVIITTGHTVTNDVANVYAKSITVSGGTFSLNSKKTHIYGNFTNNGSITGSGNIYFHAAGTISGSSTFGTAGDWFFYSTHTIAAGTAIVKTNYLQIQSGSTVTNNGTVILAAGALAITGTWINANGSSLTMGQSPSGTGVLQCSAATNTVTYYGPGASTIRTLFSAYNNLTLSGGSAHTKTISTGTLNVTGNLLIGSGVTLNCASQTINLSGNWTNNANISCTNMGTVNFNGSGTQTITRSVTEAFNNLTKSGSGTLTLAVNVNVNGTTTLSSGTLNPSAFAYNQKGASWLNNGATLNTGASGSVTFRGTTNQTIDGSTSTTFGNLIINNPGHSVTLALNQTVNGATTLTAGILDISTFNFNQSGSAFNFNGGTLNTAAAGNVVFTMSGTTTITATSTPSFGNVVVNGSGTVMLGTAINILGNLTLTTGTLNVNSSNNYTVSIAGNLTDNAFFNTQAGNVIFNGTLAQSIVTTVNTEFYDITSSNVAGVAVTSGTIIIDDIATVTTGSFGTSGSGGILLPAYGATDYGRIGDVASGASLSGTGWTIQSYINGPATAYWQYLSSPISGTTLNDWDQDPRFYMSGVNGNDGNACCPTFYSVRTYNTATNTYTNVTNLNTTLTSCKGYMLWMGDNTTQLTAPLVYDSKGTPNFGNKSINVTAGGSGNGYNLVGNPYAAPIKFSSVFSASGNLNSNFLILQENGSYVTNPNGGMIAPGQGFMAIATSTGPMQFNEGCKNQLSAPNIIRTAQERNTLRIDLSNDINGLGGQTVINFNNDAHNGYDVQYDLPFLPSPYETASNLWSTDKDGKTNIMNCLDANSDVVEIPLSVTAAVDGNQLLSFRGINTIDAYSCAWLQNNQTGERINLHDRDAYSFYAKAGEEQHFTLHFDRTGNNCPLNEQNLVESLDAQVQVYVNNDQLMGRFNFTEATDVQVVIYDESGREVVAPKNYNVMTEAVALGNPGAHGVYFIQVIEGVRVTTRKIVY